LLSLNTTDWEIYKGNKFVPHSSGEWVMSASGEGVLAVALQQKASHGERWEHANSGSSSSSHEATDAIIRAPSS
jgi:hypothetical protein